MFTALWCRRVVPFKRNYFAFLRLERCRSWKRKNKQILEIAKHEYMQMKINLLANNGFDTFESEPSKMA